MKIRTTTTIRDYTITITATVFDTPDGYEVDDIEAVDSRGIVLDYDEIAAHRAALEDAVCAAAIASGSQDFDDTPMRFDDDDDFADPGGPSALRSASFKNPRNLPCPSCGEPDRLTPADRARGYQCDGCANAAERGIDRC